MIYVFIFILLFVLEIVYFKIADRFNIIDKPNERSSHTVITLRGGGIIFYMAVLVYYLVSGYQYPWFFLGLTLVSGVSFLDDVLTLPNRTRLFVHFFSLLLMVYQLNAFSLPWYYLLGAVIVSVGIVNAYNFMDGINGITACYSLSVGSLLMWVNLQINFVEQDLLIFVMLGVFVFAFFNFRGRAKCFAGDVGAVSISYILIFALGALILKSGSLIYVLFLSVYGVDVVWTIVRRLYLGENIFEAHRSHLYQFLGNEARANRLLVSFGYGVVQLIIGLLVIRFSAKDTLTQIIFTGSLLLGLSMVYWILKLYLIRKFVAK